MQESCGEVVRRNVLMHVWFRQPFPLRSENMTHGRHKSDGLRAPSHSPRYQCHSPQPPNQR
jgi:hypothetical protein